MILGGFVFWALTHQQSELFVGAGVTLTGYGAWTGLHVTVDRELAEGEDKK